MTICNMTIEGGGRAGHDRARRHDLRVARGPPGRAAGLRRRRRALARAAHRRRRELRPRARRRRRRALAAGHLGDDAGDGRAGHRRGARPAVRRRRARAASTWASRPARRSQDIRLDRVFIGSCTNSRIGDLRAAAALVEGRKVASDVNAMVVPGSQQVRAQAEAEGLDDVFRAAGFDWRSAGCSMCLGMNPDILQPGERCASTSNRNFEGRQGRGGRTHLVSPADGRRGGHRGPFRRHPRLELSDAEPRPRPDHRVPAPCPCSTATTSTPTRSSPSSSSSGSSAPASASSSSTTGRRSTAGTCRANPILATGPNFGCGSSREHAPWALEDYGFRAIVAPTSPTSSSPTARRSACCRSCCPRRRSGR